MCFEETYREHLTPWIDGEGMKFLCLDCTIFADNCDGAPWKHMEMNFSVGGDFGDLHLSFDDPIYAEYARELGHTLAL